MVNEIEVYYNRKIQLERYEPVTHGVTLKSQVGDDEDWREVYDELAESAEDEVERVLARRVSAKKLGPEAEDEED